MIVFLTVLTIVATCLSFLFVQYTYQHTKYIFILVAVDNCIHHTRDHHFDDRSAQIMFKRLWRKSIIHIHRTTSNTLSGSNTTIFLYTGGKKTSPANFLRCPEEMRFVQTKGKTLLLSFDIHFSISYSNISLHQLEKQIEKNLLDKWIILDILMMKTY